MVNKKKVHKFSIHRKSNFKGKRKVGMDTNIHIKIHEQPILLDHANAHIFKKKDLVYTHATCAWEFANYLVETESIEFDEARNRVKGILKENNIQIVYPKNVNTTKEEIEEFEKESNKKLKEIKDKNLTCHFPDSRILVDFKKFGINKVISTDESFRVCAKFLGMEAESIPSFNKLLAKQMRMIYGYKK